MARWITIEPDAVPFDYRFPDRAAMLTFRNSGEYFVKDEVADFAVKRKYASEGKATGSTTRSRKGKTGRRTSAKKAADAANRRSSNDVDQPSRAQAGGADDRAGVADNAGE